MNLNKMLDEVTCLPESAHPALVKLREMEVRSAQRVTKILIVGNGPYNPNNTYGGKSFLAHQLMEMQWPGIEVEYHDANHTQPFHMQCIFDEVPQPGYLSRCLMVEGHPKPVEPSKPVRKQHGPRNHSKRSRQGRANRWS